MPATPADGMVITVESTQQVTAISVLANTGQTMTGAASQLIPNQPLSFIYRLTNTTWYAMAGGAGRATALVSGTAVASTSGTSINFTGIPSWAKRITVMYSGVSTNGSSQTQVQIGTGGTPTTSGYAGSVDSTTTGVSAATFTTGLCLIRSGLQAIATVMQGQVVFTNVSGNNWVGTNLGALSNTGVVMFGGTSITLGGVLDMVRFTTVNGTDLFDAGSINILYE